MSAQPSSSLLSSFKSSIKKSIVDSPSTNFFASKFADEPTRFIVNTINTINTLINHFKTNEDFTTGFNSGMERRLSSPRRLEGEKICLKFLQGQFNSGEFSFYEMKKNIEAHKREDIQFALLSVFSCIVEGIDKIKESSLDSDTASSLTNCISALRSYTRAVQQGRLNALNEPDSKQCVKNSDEALGKIKSILESAPTKKLVS